MPHVSSMTGYMWLHLGLEAHPQLLYSDPSIRHGKWSTQKPYTAEERFIMLLDVLYFIDNGRSFDIY